MAGLKETLAASPRALHTYRLDLRAMVFTGAVLGSLQLLEVIGAKAYGAGAFELALIRSGMGIGMVAAFTVATRVADRRRVPFVTWPQALARLLLAGLVAVPWLPETWRLPAFCGGAVAAAALEFVTIPARLTLYRHNYPRAVRPLVASRVRQYQMVAILVTAGGLGLFIDWNQAAPEGFGRWLGGWLPQSLLPEGAVLQFGVPLAALVSLGGVLFFARIREAVRFRQPRQLRPGAASAGLRDWGAILARDRGFVIFELAYFLFGFGNLMTLPLLVVLVTRPEYGIEASYFESMLVLSVVWQVAIIAAAPLMGRVVQRYNPILLRGVLCIFFAVDLGLMYLGYATADLWPLYAGKAIRGATMAGGLLIWELGPMHFARSQQEVPTYVGIHTVLTGVRATISPWAGASLAAAFTMGAAIAAAFALQLVAAALLIVYFLRAKGESLHVAAPRRGEGPRPPAPIT